MYKFIPSTKSTIGLQGLDCVYRLLDNTSIPFDPANTDYQNFKADILADKETLQDADGNEMTDEQAKEFVSTLP